MKKSAKDQDPKQHDAASAWELRDDDAAPGSTAKYRLADQVHGLLQVLREAEEFAHRLTDEQFHRVIREAILACGFADEVDAWCGVMEHFRSGHCHESSCRHHIPLG